MVNSFNISLLKKQGGVVLFIALIALVVMSLAAAALVRSVDTNTVIAGNLSFKQSAIIASDRGVETAMAWINSTSNSNPNSLNANATTYGYLANMALNLESAAVLKNASTWSNNSVVAVGDGISAGVEQESKNEIRYIVQRMCKNLTAPTVNHCMFGSNEEPGKSLDNCNYNQCAEIDPKFSPVYRVTVRVTGPKNTVSYTQTYVY